MKFLADENIDSPIVEKLRSRGFDVLSVDEYRKGISDDEVLRKAKDEDRVILTFDSDFSSVEQINAGAIRLTSPDRYSVVADAVEKLVGSLDSEDVRDTVIEVSPSQYR